MATQDPVILAFDTSAAHCAAALVSGDALLVCRSEEMGRGQAERLMPMLEEVLARGGKSWQDLDALGVGVGPGNFTGIRIAVSAARGLALGLGIPAVGVSGFEARAAVAPDGSLAAIPAPRGQIYLALPGDAIRVLDAEEARVLAHDLGKSLVIDAVPTQIVEAIARIAAMRWTSAGEPPAPLYARPADAAPSRDAAPVLLD